MFLEKILEKRGGKLPDFTLLIGDEESDDLMTEALYEHFATANTSSCFDRISAFTVTVGKRTCPSQYYVNDVKVMIHMIHIIYS